MLTLAQWLLRSEMWRIFIPSQLCSLIRSYLVFETLFILCKLWSEAEWGIFLRMFCVVTAASRLGNKAGQRGNVSWPPLLLLSCWSSVPPLHHDSGRQPSPPSGQDPLLEQVHRELQEEWTSPWESVLCPQRSLLQNLQGFIIIQLLCLRWRVSRRIHCGENPPGCVWKS